MLGNELRVKGVTFLSELLMSMGSLRKVVREWLGNIMWRVVRIVRESLLRIVYWSCLELRCVHGVSICKK